MISPWGRGVGPAAVENGSVVTAGNGSSVPSAALSRVALGTSLTFVLRHVPL